MSAQPLEISDAFTIEGLDNLFSEFAEDQVNVTADDEKSPTVSDEAGPVTSTEISTSCTAEVDPTSESTEPALIDKSKVSRSDLVKILEGFVGLIKSGEDEAVSQNQLSFAPQVQSTKVSTITINDRTTEVEELRGLLVEAQSTIITLLTDRVDDRAKIAGLETQLNLLPDLQAQADRALSVAINTEDIRFELEKVKQEINKVRSTASRTELRTAPRTWWEVLKAWILKRESNFRR